MFPKLTNTHKILNHLYLAFAGIVSHLPFFSWKKNVIKLIDIRVNNLMTGFNLIDKNDKSKTENIKREIKVCILRQLPLLNRNSSKKLDNKNDLIRERLDEIADKVEQDLALRLLPNDEIFIKNEENFDNKRTKYFENIKNNDVHLMNLYNDNDMKKLAKYVDVNLKDKTSIHDIAYLVRELTIKLQPIIIKKYNEKQTGKEGLINAVGAEELINAAIVLILLMKNRVFYDAINHLMKYLEPPKDENPVKPNLNEKVIYPHLNHLNEPIRILALNYSSAFTAIINN